MRLFGARFFLLEDKYLIFHLIAFGIKMKFNLGEKVCFFWQQVFSKYFRNNNIKQKVKILKKDLDKISCRYIDHFMRLVSYWDCYKFDIWTEYDKLTVKRNDEFLKTFKQPFPDILTVNPYFYSNIYGLIDLPKDVFEKIDNNIIIDGGGLNGDTALMFHHYFPNSEVHIYEPLSVNINTINKFLAVDNCDNKLLPIKKGLGNKEGYVEIKFNDVEMAQITTIDNEYIYSDKKIGLIKLDTEGFESAIIEGATKILKRDKPVLAIAIYHTPEDFFELKSKIENLNLGYKFMIRRSEITLPQADLVLIAY